MEIKRISPKVLSIYLDENDMEELDITYGGFNIFCPHTHRVLQQLLECALAQTGFNPETAERLAIEVYPIEDDACLLLFTLISSEDSSSGISRKERVEASAPTLLYFSDFQEVVNFCRKLSQSQQKTDSELYWKQGRYILVLKDDITTLPACSASYNLDDKELLLAELHEQKLILIPEKAVQKLLEYFG